MDFLPIMTTTAGLASSALNSLKQARELAKGVSDNELKQQIGEAYETLLDLREHVLTLDEENRQLKAQLAERAAYVGPIPPNGYYYAENDAGKQYPLCPRCYQGEPHRIAYMGDMDREMRRRICVMCSLVVYDSSQRSSNW